MLKEELRQKNLILRKTLNKEKSSNDIVSKILVFDTFLNAKNIMIYYPMKYEINLLPLLKVRDKNFFLPKVKGDNLVVCPYTKKLVRSDFGVMEPEANDFVSLDIIDVVFAPCLSADKNLNRLGYGKGFYDRFFSHPLFRGSKIGVCYKELLVEKIETYKGDIKLDFLITD